MEGEAEYEEMDRPQLCAWPRMLQKIEESKFWVRMIRSKCKGQLHSTVLYSLLSGMDCEVAGTPHSQKCEKRAYARHFRRLATDLKVTISKFTLSVFEELA